MGTLDLFSLKEKVAVVTGAARGLGRTMALGLAEAGADVAVVDLLKEEGEETARLIRELGRDSMFLAADILDYDGIGEMVLRIREKFGRIDILLNNAGIVYRPEEAGSASIPLEIVSRENWDNVVKVNLNGVFYCTQHVGKLMLEQKSGSIINIASMSAFVANFGRSNNAYCASKAGVVMFTRQLAADWAEKGIRVNAIAPGYMKTDLGAGPLNDPGLKDLLTTLIPMRRAGVPEDLKGIAVFLASDASAYMTGQTLIIDGGYTIW
jgi:NAD(P)-dependent dehydrogenase (short-subunit alcohol dehydrogenase family)